uniref:Uncharacterized protein n=1 Tax=Avena sativa TaxID=4498 RepID=A0ACD5ZFA1_AVESA
MALQSCHSDDFCVQLPPPPPPLPDWDWDWEWEVRCTLGGDDAAAAAARARGLESGIHDAFAALPSCGESPVSSLSSEASSGCGGGGGYLEDAVAHWSDRCKRQRTAAAEKEEVPPRCPAMASEDLQSLLQSFWDPASSGEAGDLLLHDLNAMAPGSTSSTSFVSEQGDASGEQTEGAPTPSAAAAGQGEGEADEAAAAAAGPPPRPPFPATTGALPSLPRLQKATTGRGSNYCDPASSSSSPSLPAAGKRGGGVVYPFAVVKPLGLDDGGTLSDVNRRILKRPARPVRHPVGQFACSPVVSSPHGPGLSGKAVVSLTRIRTGGKGTITIIRTRG